MPVTQKPTHFESRVARIRTCAKLFRAWLGKPLATAQRAERVAVRLRAGANRVNGGGFNYGSHFGGYMQSGNGREGRLMGLEDFIKTKTLHGVA